MYFATKDLQGKNINARQGFALPDNWQGVARVKALEKAFGTCTVWVEQEDICLANLMVTETETTPESEDKDGVQKNINKTTRRGRPSRNRDTQS